MGPSCWSFAFSLLHGLRCHLKDKVVTAEEPSNDNNPDYKTYYKVQQLTSKLNCPRRRASDQAYLGAGSVCRRHQACGFSCPVQWGNISHFAFDVLVQCLEASGHFVVCWNFSGRRLGAGTDFCYASACWNRSGRRLGLRRVLCWSKSQELAVQPSL